MASAEKITLQEFIQKQGVYKIADDLGSCRNAVYEWLALKKQPTFRYACALIKLSKGKLDFESIYRPFYNKK